MAILKLYQLLKKVENSMLDTLLIFDVYFLALVKKTKNLDKKAKIRKFFQLQLRVNKYITEILACLQWLIYNKQIVFRKAQKFAL